MKPPAAVLSLINGNPQFILAGVIFLVGIAIVAWPPRRSGLERKAS